MRIIPRIISGLRGC